MNRIKVFLLLSALIGLNSCDKKITCLDFKTGTFYVPITAKSYKMKVTINDSISEVTSKLDPLIKKYILVREGNNQVEWENAIGQGRPRYGKIEWLDDCTYRLTYDASKNELDEQEKWVNNNNGVLVSITKIGEKCLHYDASITAKKENSKISYDGEMCID